MNALWNKYMTSSLSPLKKNELCNSVFIIKHLHQQWRYHELLDSFKMNEFCYCTKPRRKSVSTACRYAIYHSCHFLGKRRLDVWMHNWAFKPLNMLWANQQRAHIKLVTKSLIFYCNRTRKASARDHHVQRCSFQYIYLYTNGYR